MPATEFSQPWNQFLGVVQAGHGVTHSDEDLGPDLAQRRGIQQLLIIRALVVPLAILRPDFRREEVHGLRRLLEEVPVEQLA